MKALVIGGGGFVGSYLANQLSNELGFEVFVTKTEREQLSLANAKIYDCDILQKEQIEQVLKTIRPNYIFHLAAQSSVAHSWKNPGLTIDVNVKGCVNVLDAIRTLDYKPRVLLIGSGEEYGHIQQAECPIKETTALRPGNIYAATKCCQNMLGKIYSDAYDMDIMMVRAFNHIGPNQAPFFVVSDFCKQVAEIECGLKEPIMYVGNLSAKRDFTDVRDVVRAYGMLMQFGKTGETYNVGTGHAIEIKEILNQIIAMSNVKIEVKIDADKLRPVDVPIIEPDISKINECTGWKPEISLSQTLSETLTYWREICNQQDKKVD
jgi:GDP-4-dehydro-6-deoxy-D-mannose reductase